MKYITEDGTIFDDAAAAELHEQTILQTREVETAIRSYVETVAKTKPGSATTRMVNAILGWERYKVASVPQPVELQEELPLSQAA